MSKKSKGVGFDPTTLYGIGMYEDAKARRKHQTLLQDYEELRKEADVMRSKLEAAKQRRLMLAAEFRFLQRRHKRLVKMKSMNSFDEQNLVQEPNTLMQTKMTNESRRRSQAQPKSKKRHDVKQAAEHNASPITNQSHKKMSYGGKEAKGHRLSSSSHLVSDLNHQGILHVSKETLPQNTASVIVQNHNERIISANDANLRNSAAAFDLNQDSTPSGKEASLPSQAPIFDLNEISTGDEDFQGNGEAIMFGEAKKSLIGGINEEPQSDLKLAICRNAGESSSRPGKRKISWQDPVALRV